MLMNDTECSSANCKSCHADKQVKVHISSVVKLQGGSAY